MTQYLNIRVYTENIPILFQAKMYVYLWQNPI